MEKNKKPNDPPHHGKKTTLVCNQVLKGEHKPEWRAKLPECAGSLYYMETHDIGAYLMVEYVCDSCGRCIVKTITQEIMKYGGEGKTRSPEAATK